jgi:hypothetical protein
LTQSEKGEEMAGGYRKAVVTFIDILGFRKIVEERSQEEVLEIVEKLREISNRIVMRVTTDDEVWGRDPLNVYSINFSDSLIRAKYVDYYDIVDIIDEIASLHHIQTELFVTYGIIIRGSMTFGDIYFDDMKNIVYGSAMVRAYELENGSAIYPRIILDPEIEWKDDNVINIDFDGNKYIDYLEEKYTHIMNQPNGNYINKNSIIERLLICEESIEKYILSSKNHDMRVIAKHNWIITHYNNAVTKILEWSKKHNYPGTLPHLIPYITPPTKDPAPV